jgi:hypothetical protein
LLSGGAEAHRALRARDFGPRGLAGARAETWRREPGRRRQPRAVRPRTTRPHFSYRTPACRYALVRQLPRWQPPRRAPPRDGGIAGSVDGLGEATRQPGMVRIPCASGTTSCRSRPLSHRISRGVCSPRTSRSAQPRRCSLLASAAGPRFERSGRTSRDDAGRRAGGGSSGDRTQDGSRGDRAVQVRARMRNTLQQRYFSVVIVRDGKIARLEHFMDQEDARQAAGLTTRRASRYLLRDVGSRGMTTVRFTACRRPPGVPCGWDAAWP